ncbi:hypothetical protein [Chroococcidiopsis sp.]|uniref:hypothetical protein n=1 Tax=Chroococcidiopsis sp. TaxID=3088168 RepID=UPI003F3BAB91
MEISATCAFVQWAIALSCPKSQLETETAEQINQVRNSGKKIQACNPSKKIQASGCYANL